MPELKQYVPPRPQNKKVRQQAGDALTLTVQDKKDRELLAAVSNGDIEAVKAAIKSGQSVDVANENGASATHLASRAGEVALLDALLSKRPEVMHADKQGNVRMISAE
jgi:ankyrin repeat protein